ncbi:MAG TPA: SCO family protein [Myxococcota bacterium]|nr:SCO family protein [Myxococcota bacterium]
MWVHLLLACSAPPPERLFEVPDFQLTERSGAPVDRATLRDRVWVAGFVFTSCPGPCPMLSAQMATIQAHYAKDPDFRLVSFTVDPATDRPEVLRGYADRFGADPEKWLFLTGDPQTVQTVVVDGFKTMLERLPSVGGQPPNVMHSERFLLVDRKGWVRAILDPKAETELFGTVDAVLHEGRWW